MLSGQRQQQDSGQTWERGLDLCAARRTPEASPNWDEGPRGAAAAGSEGECVLGGGKASPSTGRWGP